jgi:hypothetical protein
MCSQGDWLANLAFAMRAADSCEQSITETLREDACLQLGDGGEATYRIPI